MSSQMSATNFNLLGSNSLKDEITIKNVWNYNLQEEFYVIRRVVQKYHWVAMDTEFPGVVARPIGEFRSTADYQYQLLRCNVDLLRIIQLGLTFMDENGIVLMDNISWLSFHSGYDFGYLLKLLTDQNLPQEESNFFEILRMYFPTIYDVKYLMKLCKNLKGGLQEVADQLELRRVGPQHQAGSDSLLTGMAFFKIKEIFFDGNIESTSGHLYGLGAPFATNANNFQDNGDNGSPS